jgi:alkylhydroperoxidase/carboxymuconolactone decarboxylase family protein YurZ
MTGDNERLARGAAMLATVLGPEMANRRSEQPTDPAIRTWRRYLVEEGWGGVWCRPGLDLKARSLVTIVALATAGKVDELELHLVGAIRNGWTLEELTEVFIHLSSYAGYPAAVGAFRVAERVFADARLRSAAPPDPAA